MEQPTSGNVTGSLLLVLPLSVHRKDGRIYIENQAANGLDQWLRHFTRMTLAVKLLAGDPPSNAIAIDTLQLGDRLTVELMPTGWTPLAHFQAYPEMKRRVTDWIDRHDYLQFALGGAWGDWAALGALIAARRRRKASIWTDRVESEVMRISALRQRGLRRIRGLLYSRIAHFLERRVLRASAVGLFHGKDTFDAYHRFSANPFLVHDIHVKKQDRITAERLDAKTEGCATGPLEIVYMGRVHPDKGVMDWLETLRILSEKGIAYRARWFGAGPQRDEARARVAELGLAGSIFFPGLLSDRSEVLEALRSAHMMLFCHQTPESPRCLIEALISGTPIIGYRSAYPEDLISENKGGVLTPMDPSQLADEVLRLHHDRTTLATLVRNAALDGYDMNDEAVFTHRSELMKRYS